jgi:hypothetical protein
MSNVPDDLRSILFDKNLGERAKILGCLIRLMCDKDKKLEGVSVQQLADAIGAAHRNRVTDAIHELVKARFLTVNRLPNALSVYTMTPKDGGVHE